MIYTETFELKGRQFTRTYSNRFYIERDGVEYSEANDPFEFNRTYMETEHELEESNRSADEATESDYIDALNTLGVDTNEEN